MRNGTGEPSTRRVPTFGEQTERRSREPRELAGERTQIGITRVALRERAQPNRASRSIGERRCG